MWAAGSSATAPNYAVMLRRYVSGFGSLSRASFPNLQRINIVGGWVIDVPIKQVFIIH